MIFKRGRYSGYLRPLSYVFDLSIIIGFAIPLFEQNSDFLNFILFISFAWIINSLLSKFYEIYRYTSPTKIFTLIAKQTIIFLLLIFAFIGFFNELKFNPLTILKYVLVVMLSITLLKFTIYYLLKKYRVLLGGNIRRVVIVGLNQKTDQLGKFFIDGPDYGYNLIKTFENDGDKYNWEHTI